MNEREDATDRRLTMDCAGELLLEACCACDCLAEVGCVLDRLQNYESDTPPWPTDDAGAGGCAAKNVDMAAAAARPRRC